MRYILFVFILLFAKSVCAQTIVTIEGQTYTNSSEVWTGVVIPRSTPTNLTFRNNAISSMNTGGYMLEAGDEIAHANNNNLAGAVITGNRFRWIGSDMNSITHGLFTGHNINVVIMYNYLDRVPMGIIRKSTNNMINTSGGVAYNIVKSPNTGIVVKGMSGVCIYNNTLYQDRSTSETGRGLIDIYTNNDITPKSVSHGTKIRNNIFYTRYQTLSINVMDQESLTGLECDYNIYYCETGSPKFNAGGSIKTFAEWQAMGYDTHSRVVNPNFQDFVNFVPAARLDYGTDLGTAWAKGLSVNATWGTTDPETTMQNGKWQVGAVVYKEVVTQPAPINQPPLVIISSPAKGNAFLAPATVTIDATASDPDGTVSKVEFYNGTVKLGERTSAPWSFIWKEVQAGTYSLTAAATDNSNSRTISVVVTVVVEKAAPAVNQLPSVAISSHTNNVTVEAPGTITLTANASDSDGSVVKVEYFNGQEKLGESLTHPWSFSFECKEAVTYEIFAKASDNLNGSTTSAPVIISVIFSSEYNDLITLYPNPNDGNFTMDMNSIAELDDQAELAIVNLSGRTVYRTNISPGEPSRQIDITNSLSGNYILIMAYRNKILSTTKLIKN